MTTSTRTSTTPGWWLATVASTAAGEACSALSSLPGISTSAGPESTSAGPESAVEVEEDDVAAELPASGDAESESGSRGVLPSTPLPEETPMPPASTDTSTEMA